MAESEVELQEVFSDAQASVENIQDAKFLKKQAFEKSLLKTIKKGDLDRITERLTPRALTKCNTNALLMAMKVSSELRRLADGKGPDEEEFRKLANSVDEFTTSLIDPLRSSKEARHAFGDSLDDVMDDAIELEQKTANSVERYESCQRALFSCESGEFDYFCKNNYDEFSCKCHRLAPEFIAHPVVYNLMSQKWYGELGRMKRCDWLSVQRWKWLLLNIWCLFDLMLFPFLFALFYAIHLVREKTFNKELDIGFVISATSTVADQTFSLMKNSVKYAMRKCSNSRASFHVTVRGEETASSQLTFNRTNSDIDSMLKRVDELERGMDTTPVVYRDLRRVSEAFLTHKNKRTEKVVIFFTDNKTDFKPNKKLAKEQVKRIKNMGAKIIPVAIGCHVNLRELETINNDGRDVIHFGEYEDHKIVGKRILQEINGKDLYECYLEYFTTPYFIFVRDTLSYLVLLGLHFAICLAPSSVAFSGIEWAILVFFVGRIVMEGTQFIDSDESELADDGTLQRGARNRNGTKYTNLWKKNVERVQEQRAEKMTVVFFKKLRKYLSDRWNILDFITLLIYLTTFTLRMLTWTFSDSVVHNHAVVIAGYFYGLITLFLTLRAFGQIMETAKGVGSIQIALFHIIFDVVAILGQFAATILAFATALTKIFMAERSYLPEGNRKEDFVCKNPGISCWLMMVKHLCWSLLGMPSPDPLNSVGVMSETLADILYGIFLVMGVVFIINMMIALLSNTYQRVEDNSLKEWSFKKAITIQTYSGYHPIPVPFNLVSTLVIALWRCRARCKGQLQDKIRQEKKRNHALDAVIDSLQLAYITSYGHSFPLTDERKMDHVLLQTEQNRQMANQIAQRTFEAHGYGQGVLPRGPKAWRSRAIRVNGCLLTNEGPESCKDCEDSPADFHGARYIVPFSPEFPHFEVLIQEASEQRMLGVGVVWEDYDAHKMPGWSNRTVGYHIDDGKIFHAGEDMAREIEDAMAYRGDLIGCTVMFEMATNGKVPIVFTLNGKQITEEKMEYNPGKKPLYPFIGMGNKVQVLAKMYSSGGNVDSKMITCSSRDEPTRSARDEHELEMEQLVRTLNVLEELKDNIRGNLDEVDRTASDIDRELEKAGENFQFLRSEIFFNFKSLEDVYDWEGSETASLSIAKRVSLAIVEDTDSSHEDDGVREKTKAGLMREVKENLEQLQKITTKRFGAVLKLFKETEKKAKKHAQEQEEFKQKVKKRFPGLPQDVDFSRESAAKKQTLTI